MLGKDQGIHLKDRTNDEALGWEKNNWIALSSVKKTNSKWNNIEQINVGHKKKWLSHYKWSLTRIECLKWWLLIPSKLVSWIYIRGESIYYECSKRKKIRDFS